MTQPDPHVQITLADIYRQLVTLTTQVQAMGGQLDRVTTTGGDHETRLRDLERARWPLPTVALLIALGSAATAVVALLTR